MKSVKSVGKMFSLFSIMFFLFLVGVRVANANTFELHIVNASGQYAWNQVDPAVGIFVGEAYITYSLTWSVGDNSTAVVYVDIGDIDPEEIGRVEVYGQVWNEDETETVPVWGWSNTGAYGATPYVAVTIE